MTLPPPPGPPAPDLGDPRARLAGRVTEALLALPGYFDSTTNIEGLAATDLFALNTVLGATIEVQVVDTLNRMRDVWDPDNEWPMHRFERQAQTFPDVLLRRRTGSGEYDVAMGVELKGWYVLAKEGVPSFRYRVTPAACTDWDLLVVVPWRLSNVLAGTPRVGPPGVWSARHAAEFRNHWWRHVRSTARDRAITSPERVEPYMRRGQTDDKPAYDGGGNFGRIARIGIMAGWVDETLREPIAGIPARDWIEFVKRYAEGSDPDTVWEELQAIVRTRFASGSERAARDAADALGRLLESFGFERRA